MTVRTINQLVFGYEDGHRLLGGSVDIPSEPLATLLGATDAPVEDSSDCLITGLPIEAISSYALCFTWSAPELPRPGAIWSHVLLLHPEHLESFGRLSVFGSLARRPKPGEIEGYGSVLAAPEDRRAQEPVSREIVADIVAAAYGGNKPLVIQRDLAESARALFAVWEFQWPALRKRFEFCTRESARTSPPPRGVVVAREVRGMLGHQQSSSAGEKWQARLVDAVVSAQEPELTRFLAAFGPNGPAALGAMRDLAQLFECVAAEDHQRSRGLLERIYPEASLGAELKGHLFGQELGEWWSAPERSRVGALIGATVDAWDVEQLRLERRICDWIENDGANSLVNELAGDGPSAVRETFLAALVRSGRPSDVGPVVQCQPDLAVQWIREAPELAHAPETWSTLEEHQAAILLGTLDSSDAEIAVAAILGGQTAVVLDLAGMLGALLAISTQRSLDAGLELVRVSGWAQVLDALHTASRVGEDGHPPATESEVADLRLLLGAVTADSHRVPGLLAALERRRSIIDDIWLRAAAAEMPRARSNSKTLEVTFGPLYRAIREDRLHPDCWAVIEEHLPEAADRARRLQGLLVEVAKTKHWKKKKLTRALRGAGSHAQKLYRDLEEDEDTLGARLRRVVDTLRGW